MISQEAYQVESVTWWSFRDCLYRITASQVHFFFHSFFFPSYSLTFPQAFKDIRKALLFFRPIHFKCVVGEIPQLLFNISSLRFLNLAVNNLEGEISFSLSQCRELQVISLSFNQFIGGIPQAIGSLSNLEKLYLGYNKLIGTLFLSSNFFFFLFILSLSLKLLKI